MKNYKELKDSPKLKVKVAIHNTIIIGDVTLEGVICSFVATYADDHVSVSPYNNSTPTWEMMCKLKDIFYGEEEEAYQIHPKKSEYVNIKGNCLHLWGKGSISSQKKKPVHIYEGSDNFRAGLCECGCKCHSRMNYCPSCGTLIDWSEDND